MGADLTLGQSDGRNQVFQCIELERCQVQPFGNGVHHVLIFRRTGSGVLCKFLVLVPLEFLDKPARDKFHITFRCGKVDERTTVNQRRTGNTHVYLLCSVFKKHLGVVAQLRAAHDGVVTEQHLFAFEHVAVGYQLHFRHKRAHLLVARREAARPCRCIFRDGTHIRHTLSCRIPQCHSNTGIGNAAGAVHFHIIGLAHSLATGKTYLFHIFMFIA